MNLRLTLVACVPLLALAAPAHAQFVSAAALWCPAALWDPSTHSCDLVMTQTEGVRIGEGENSARRTAKFELDRISFDLELDDRGRVLLFDDHGRLVSTLDTHGDRVTRVWLGDFVGTSAIDLGLETDGGDLWGIENLSGRW